MLACHIVDVEGGTRGVNYGEVELDDELKSSFGKIAASLWDGLRKVETVGGPLKMVLVTYKNFKPGGIPVPGTDVGLLLTIQSELDSELVRERAMEFLKFLLMGKLDSAPNGLGGKKADLSGILMVSHR